MSQQEEEGKQTGIPDEALPEDLVPGEENPLAEGLPPGETVDGLLTEGKRGDQDDDAPAEGSGDGGAGASPPPAEESSEPHDG